MKRDTAPLDSWMPEDVIQADSSALSRFKLTDLARAFDRMATESAGARFKLKGFDRELALWTQRHDRAREAAQKIGRALANAIKKEGAIDDAL